MLPDMEKAIQLLNSGNYTCVLYKEGILYTSTQRGVKPLMEHLGKTMSGFCAADKVVGKATALLYCLLDVKAVHANVISESALNVLQSHNIQTSWDTRVPYIINRAGTGRCPMEIATQHISDPQLAPEAIGKALAKLTKGEQPI